MDFNIFRNIFKDSDHSHRYPTFEDDDPGNGRHDIFFDDIFERYNSSTEIFNEMEDMFNKMFSVSFGMIGSPKLGEVMPNEPNPRSLMLKDIDEESCSCLSVKEPEVVSSSVKESGLLPHNFGKEVFSKPQNFSYSKFSSIKTVRLPDGTVEEHRTVVDSDGKKTTKIRRTIGDTSHEVITKCNTQGLKEKEENFKNMDEQELPDFEKAWDKLKNNTSTRTDITLSPPDSKPSYLSFLNKIFG